MKGSPKTVASGSTLAAVFASGSDVYFFLATLAPTQSGSSVTDFYTNTATASLTYSSLNDLSGTDVAITAGNINRNSVILALNTGPTISATIQAFVGVFAFTNTVALGVINPVVYYLLSTLSAKSSDFKSEAAGPFGSDAAEVDFSSVDGLSGQKKVWREVARQARPSSRLV